MTIRCGKCQVTLEHHDCLECGTSLLTPCPGCHYPVKWGAHFCQFCGLPVEGSRVESPGRLTIMNEEKCLERAKRFPYYGYYCPICGIHARMEDAFRCHACGESFICKSHRKTKAFVCESCFPRTLAGNPELLREGPRSAMDPPGPDRRPGGSGFEGMIYVPEGEFLMGDERRRVFVPAFYIDPFPVTNLQYQAFDPSHAFPPERGHCPISVGLSWFHAKAYARWAGKRLPTEAEWEKAARGTDGRVFPWGNTYDVKRCNTFESEILVPTPVGSYPEGRSPYGCYDMAGMVWEWTETWYDEERNFKVVKGGSYYDEDFFARCASRMGFDLLFRVGFILGFRCVKSAG